MHDKYPGTTEHQRLQQALVDFYREDPRILAIVVFGSVACGDWHPLSDLDLDIVITDGVAVDAVAEVRALCECFAAFGERAAIILPTRDDGVDVVLESLRQLSIRYHPLALTSPNIVDSMRVLWGRIDAGAIGAAGSARRRPSREPLGVLVGQCVRHLLEVEGALQGHRLWRAIASLHAARVAIVEIHGAARGFVRGWHAFEAAPAELQVKLGATLPSYAADSVASCLRLCIALLTDDLDEIAQGRVALSEPEREVLASILQRRAENRYASSQAGMSPDSA